MNKIKPLLDSYYAPYTVSTRYWTGFMLLIRCTLYIVFSYNSIGGTTKSLLAIITTFSGIVTVVYAWFSIRIYKRAVVNLIETSMYMNLVILSAASLAGVNTPLLTYTLVGAVFVITKGIVVYYFTAKSAWWLQLRGKVLDFAHFAKVLTSKNRPTPHTESCEQEVV